MDNPKKTAVASMDKFELAEDKLFDYLIDKGGLLDDPSSSLLLPASQRRAKLKKEMHEAAEQLDLNLDLAPALRILKEEGASYLDAAKFEEMDAQLDKMPTYLDQLDLTQPAKESLCTSLHISDSTLKSINKVGVAKYDEGNLEGSLSIFGLLATLDHDNENSLYRVGIAAAQLEKWDIALKAFTNAIKLSPEFLGARVFSAECHVRLGQINEAKEDIKEAKRLIEISKPDPIWVEVLTSIEEEAK